MTRTPQMRMRGASRPMLAWRGLLLWVGVLLVTVFAASLAQAQTQTQTQTQTQYTDAPGPVGGAPAALPSLPELQDLRLQVPLPVRAAGNVLGLGRQRLALVVGLGTVGSRLVLDTAPRDTQAVAGALRAGGFVVMLREDISGTELRASIREFRDRLQPGAIGLIYVTGLGVHLGGQNLLLPRDARLDPTLTDDALAAQWRQVGVPLQDTVDALMSGVLSPRMLVVDAAYRHPALARLPQQGLQAQRLPPGVMALFGHALSAAQEVPAAAVLPQPPPADPREIAATRFARVLVGSLMTPRISSAEALRRTQRAIVEGSDGQSQPWLAGETDAQEDLAEISILDAFLPRTQEDLVRAGLKEVVRQGSGNSAAAATAGQPPPPQPIAPRESGVRAEAAPDAAKPPLAEPAPAPGGLGTAAAAAAPTTLSAIAAAGTVVAVVGSAASTAANVVAVAAAVKAAEAAATVSLATTAAGTAASVGSNVVALGARLLSGNSAEAPAAGAAGALSQALPAAPLATVTPLAPAALAAPATALASAALAPLVAAPTAPVPGIASGIPQANPASSPRPARPTAQLGELPVNQVAPLPGNPHPPAPLAAAPALPLLRQALDNRTEQVPSGGERPAFLPRVNMHGHAEGDTFTFQVVDTWRGEVARTYTTAIEQVLGDSSLVGNGQSVEMDPQGRLKSRREADGSFSDFEPVEDLWWSDVKPGDKRDVRFKENFRQPNRGAGQAEYRGTSRAGKPRKIETPAGSFDALPIETEGWKLETLRNGTRIETAFERTVWYAPKLGHPVQIDIKDSDSLGRLLRRERVELLHAQSSRSKP